MKKNYKASILGMLLIACGLYVVITKEGYNETLIGAILTSGVMLFFVPNRFINLLEKLIIGRVLFDKEKEAE